MSDTPPEPPPTPRLGTPPVGPAAGSAVPSPQPASQPAPQPTPGAPATPAALAETKTAPGVDLDATPRPGPSPVQSSATTPPPAQTNGSHPVQAVISDVHGNMEALRAVLADIRTQNVDEIVCLGDVVGYGPDPIDCLHLVRRVVKWSLCGNHDAAMFMAHGAVGFRESAAKAVAWQRRMMMPGFFSLPGKVARWRWLENLPASKQQGRVTYVHASPRDPLMEYVLEEDFQNLGFGPSDKALDMFERFDWLCFVGHSHRPGVATHDFKWVKPHELDNMTYYLPPNRKTLVNIGAVGQPRDQNPDACYVIFDGVKIRYRRVKYDVATTQRKIRAVPELEPILADRLAKGM